MRTPRAASFRLPALLGAGLLLACAPATSVLEAQQEAAAPGAPKLAVLLVVDQLRADLVDRYDDLFTGGIRRLLDEGRVFPNTTHDHLLTETAPGHATLATGTHPSRHGVVSNQWFVRRDGAWQDVENVMDPRAPLIVDGDVRGASPTVLEREGIADSLLEAVDGSRVLSFSGKARGAVLLGGRSASHVYWFEPAVGRFVTSTWYREREPGWLNQFNDHTLPILGRDSVWTSTVPAEVAHRSRPDTASYEGDGEHTYFPHRYVDAVERWGGLHFWTWFALTPALDRATLHLVRSALRAEELGQDEVPDLLLVSLSQTDRVGHDYGPLSREQMDNLLRLDRELGTFFEYLDETVGKGRWSVLFTSDHGAQDVPEWEAEHGVPAIRLNRDTLAALQEVVHRVARSVRSTEPAKLSRPLAAEVEALPWVARAWSHQELETRQEPADSFDVLARNSHHPYRPTGILGRLGVQFMVEEHVLPFGYPEGGSTHQSGYYHDRHVPFVLMGPGVTPGVDPRRVSATHVAPTLARVLGVRVPGDLDGEAVPLGPVGPPEPVDPVDPAGEPSGIQR